MAGFRAFGFSVMVIILIAVNSVPLDAQAASQTRRSASIAINITLQKDQVPLGQKPLALVAVKNITSQMVCLSTGTRFYRIHIERKDGEPPKTEFHRHLHGEFRPGDGPDLASGPVVCPDIAPGTTQIQRYDLSAYYDLSIPGEYTVYIEVLDESQGPVGSGIWLRSNTAKFEMIPPAQ